LLKKHHVMDASQIVQSLKDDFSQWQGKEPRRDDVTALIFKL